MAKKLSSTKARKILKDKSVRGHSLSARQKRFMGWIAGGRRPKRKSK